jgi:Na+-transporting NADH:ubiquinone oxidoreductase subunit D
MKKKTACAACGAAGWIKPVKDGIGAENPVLRHALGICSALAVTGFVSTTLVMGASLLFVASMSCLLISLIRHLIPHQVRLIAQMLVVSTLVILVHLYLQAYYFDMSRALGPYVGLIITNCLILGRTEAYAIRNPPLASMLDGFGCALGYALVLLVISVIREIIGRGTLLGYAVMPENFMPMMLLSSAPGAFFALGVVVWVVRAIFGTTETAGGCCSQEAVSSEQGGS